MRRRACATASCRRAKSGSIGGTDRDCCLCTAEKQSPAPCLGRPASPTRVSTSSVTPAPRVLTRTHGHPSARSSRARGPGRLHLALLGLIVLAGALVRLRYLNEPMRWDEA